MNSRTLTAFCAMPWFWTPEPLCALSLGQTLMQLGKPDEAKKEMDRWKELKGDN